jgi:NADPH:quinone reductase
LEQVTKFTGGKMVNVVYDGVGKSTFDTSLKCLARLGSMVSFGNASGKVDDIDIMKLVPNCVRLSRPSLFKLIKTGADFKPRKMVIY